jgi:putative flippase GtrA
MVPERHRKLVRELTAFGFAGAINTALGFALFNWLLGLGSLTANALSTAAATGTSFVLNRYVTYRHRPRTSLRRELPLFVFFNLLGLGIQQLIMLGGKVAFGLSDTDRLELNLVRMGSVAVGTVFLLLTYRTFVFKKGPVEAPVSAELPIPVELAQEAEFDELTAPLETESIDADWELGELLETDKESEAVRSRL